MLAEQKSKTAQQEPISSSDTSIAKETPELVPDVDPAQPGYTEPNHWLSIIEDIKDIREQLSPGNQSQDTRDGGPSSRGFGPSSDGSIDTPSSTADLSLRQSGVGSLDDVLKGLPPKHLCDFWVSLYFQARFTTLRECSLFQVLLCFLCVN